MHACVKGRDSSASSYQLWAPAPPFELLVTPPFLLSGLSGLDTEEGAATAGVCGLCLYLSLRSMWLVGTVSELMEASVLLMSLIEDILTRSDNESTQDLGVSHFAHHSASQRVD